jgi:predicted nucleic acid-binding protein
MIPVVLDASAAVAVAQGEPAGPAVHIVLTELLHARREIIVPGHFWIEVSNAFRSRSRPFGKALVEAIHRLDTYAIRTVDSDRATLLHAIAVAERCDLNPYDAMYVALADVAGADLLSLDRAMTRAVGDRALTIPGEHRLAEEPAPYATGDEHGRRSTIEEYEELAAFLLDLRTETRRVHSQLGAAPA